MSQIELTNNLKKRFASDFKLPINVFSEPYFEYYVELYDPVFNIKTKLEWFDQVLSNCNNTEEFFSRSEKIGRDVKELIIQTEAYKNFNNADINKLFPLEEKVKQQNIYIEPNIGKKLISIDLQQANFNSLDLFDLKKEINAFSYKELLNKFTDESYFLESKKIRQVIFGDLNPKRQQRLQKYIINEYCKTLAQHGCVFTSASSDEIIIENQDMNVADIKEMLKNVPEKHKFFRVEEFMFEPIIEGRDFFIKTTYQEDQENKIEFKNVASHFFAQVYKKHFDLPLHENDLLFYHEGFLSQFKEALFTIEPTMVKKSSKKMK